MTDDHTGFWDCVEAGLLKRSARRLTPDADCDKVRVWTCPECGRRHAEEIWFFDNGDVAETNRYGLKNAKSIDIETILEPYL